jgi:hypothetical protein
VLRRIFGPKREQITGILQTTRLFIEETYTAELPLCVSLLLLLLLLVVVVVLLKNINTED